METPHQRPAWLNDGIVFGGAGQEPLIFRIRRGDGIYVDAEELYAKERSEDTVVKLVEAGGNLSTINAHKLFGLRAEEEDIQSAVHYGELCHKHGVKVGVYVGESLGFELLFKEKPEARDWVGMRYDGKPLYWVDQTFRYFPCKSHPGWIGFQKEVIAMAINRIKVDFFHFDNVYFLPEPNSCHCKVCRQKFRDFLGRKYTPAQLKKRIGFSDISELLPPIFPAAGCRIDPRELQSIRDPLHQEWIDYRCQAIADMYGELCAYARALKPDIVLECNPAGAVFNQAFYLGVDLARLLRHGHFFWVEDGNITQLEPDGKLVSNIRSFKIARTMKNGAFVYLNSESEAATMLSIAETMAFNYDCIGPCGTQKPPIVNLVRFYRKQREIYDIATETQADVAVLRSFQSLAWESFTPHLSVSLVEQILIQKRIPFHIVFDEGLDNLAGYRALVLADVRFMSDEAIAKVQRYVEQGGGLLAIGQTSLCNEMSRIRHKLGLADFLGADGLTASQIKRGKGRAAYIPKVIPREPLPEHEQFWVVNHRYWHLPQNTEEIYKAIIACIGGRASVEVDVGPIVAVEIARRVKPPMLVLHLLNYAIKEPLGPVPVSCRIPASQSAKAVRFLDPEDGTDRKIPFAKDGDRIAFSIPRLKIYAIARIDL